jgi:hypothetical protein
MRKNIRLSRGIVAANEKKIIAPILLQEIEG